MSIAHAPLPQAQNGDPMDELERLRLALSIDGVAVYDWSLADDRIHWDDTVGDILVPANTDLIQTGQGYRTLLDREGSTMRDNLARNGATDFAAFQIEYQFRTKDSSTCWLEDRGRRLFDDDGKPSRVIGVLRVITERKQREARLRYLATYDELTGHLTRSRLKERLDQFIAKVRQDEGQGVYLVAGIDDLAVINADYGFDVADEVIAGIGERLQKSISLEDRIGRTAGNKFGILISDSAGRDVKEWAQKLVDAVHNTVVDTSAGPVPVSVSVGCVGLPQGAQDSQQAMTRAEEALDQAKRSGRASVSAFSVSQEIESNRRRNAHVADKIVSALNDRRIKIAYQPIVSAQTMDIYQYECLVRMILPDGEIELAGNFIPHAEQLGLVRLLDRRVLELVVESLRENPDIRLALNVSGMTATESLCLEGYLAYIEANQDVADRMTVELTETSAIRDMEESVRFLSRLRELGCKVAIDDFGAGYTSFRNLQALVVDSVKIDGAFIRGLAQSEDNQLFVRTLVDLAKNFGLETVAEWVSSAEEAELLRDYGVDYLQGYYLGQPAMGLDFVHAGMPLAAERVVQKAS